MILNLQKFLREIPDALNILQGEKYAIIVRRHTKFPNLVLFKYSQIDSPMSDPMVQECRGIILDEKDNWNVIAFPYKKFWNHGEGNAANIDWNTARVYEKLDGTCCTMYWNPYDNAWNVSTLGSPDASGTVGDLGGTVPSDLSSIQFNSFADLFWFTFKAMGYDLNAPMIRPDKNFSYMFELMTPENRVVIPHKDRRLILHGVRDNKSFQEYPPSQCNVIFETVRTFALKNFDEVVKMANEWSGLDHEGFVVCDGNFNRVKVKNLRYVAIAHIKDNFSSRRIWELIRQGETEEFLTYFNEYRGEFDKATAVYNSFLEEIPHKFGYAHSVTTNKKEFAMMIKDLSYSCILFGMYDGKIDNDANPLTVHLSQMPILSFERLMENYAKSRLTQ